MNKLVGNKDVDFLVLMQLDDRELGIVCQSNKYVRSLCNDENFWLKKLENTYKLDENILKEAKIFFEFKTWKELYIYLKSKYASVRGIQNIIKNKEEIKKLFDLVEYPDWIDKNIFQQYKKRQFLDISETFGYRASLLRRFFDAIFNISIQEKTDKVDEFFRSLPDDYFKF